MSDAAKPDAVSAAAKATTAPFRALALLLKNPGLWPYAVIPCVIALVLLVALAFGAYYGHGWLVSLVADAPVGDEWGVWYGTAWILTALALALGVPVLSALLAPAVCEPFLGVFARRVRAIITGETPTPPAGLYADYVAPVVHLGLRLGFLAAVHIVLLVFWLVPGVGPIIYAVIGFGVTCGVLGLTYLDYALDTAPVLLPPKARRKFFYSHWPGGLMLGVVAAGTALIPCLTFVLLPVLVAAAVILYIDLGGDRAVQRATNVDIPAPSPDSPQVPPPA